MYLDFATYEEYGGTLELAAFTRFSFRADKIIDTATQNRIKAMSIVPQAVKRCVFELIPMVEKQSNSGGIIASRSQSDGTISQSENYANPTDDIDIVLEDYLGSEYDDNGIPLLYVGVL